MGRTGQRDDGWTTQGLRTIWMLNVEEGEASRDIQDHTLDTQVRLCNIRCVVKTAKGSPQDLSGWFGGEDEFDINHTELENLALFSLYC